MNPAYEQSEVLFINQGSATSAADALSIAIGPVPQKKLWTFQAAAYLPGVAETRTVLWNVVCPNGTTEIALTIPVSIALSSTRGFPLLSPGDEFTLLPGQFLQARRDVATAGSVMYILALYIETDVPLYQYIEPQQKSRMRKRATGLLMPELRRVGGGTEANPGGLLGFPTGGGGGPYPK